MFNPIGLHSKKELKILAYKNQTVINPFPNGTASLSPNEISALWVSSQIKSSRFNSEVLFDDGSSRQFSVLSSFTTLAIPIPESEERVTVRTGN